MYTLVSSLCLGNTVGAQWETPDLSAVFLYSAYMEYKRFYLTLSHPAVEGPIYVDMNQVRTEASGFVGTVTQWLISLADRSLPTVEALPNEKVRYAKFANATQTGYNIELALAGLNYSDNYPALSMTDLKLTRPQFGTDMTLLESHCLTTVNGFIHQCTSTETEAFILDGAVTGRMGNDNHVGIYSFLDIGRLTKINLDPVNIVPMELNTSLKEKIRFSVTADLTGKSYFLVLGGYLVMPEENVFFQTGENTFSLDLNLLPYEERLLESHSLINLSSLDLVPPNNAPDGFDMTQVWSDDVIRKYMTLSQSFFVVVDTDHLSVDRKVIQKAAFPGQFICWDNPVYPVVGGHGKFFEFWKQEEQGKWTINTRDTYYRRFVYTEGPRKRATYASGALDTTRVYDHSQAYMLEISTLVS